VAGRENEGLMGNRSIFRLNNWEIEFDKLQDDRVLSRIDAKGEHYSLGDGDLGLWVATNPVIWTVLAPVLKLVGRYLDSMHTSAWVRNLNVPFLFESHTNNK
jgi:hypothetical protein